MSIIISIVAILVGVGGLAAATIRQRQQQQLRKELLQAKNELLHAYIELKNQKTKEPPNDNRHSDKSRVINSRYDPDRLEEKIKQLEEELKQLCI